MVDAQSRLKTGCDVCINQLKIRNSYQQQFSKVLFGGIR